jgi:hypothetical protein
MSRQRGRSARPRAIALARLRPPAERCHDVRDDDGDANEQDVGECINSALLARPKSQWPCARAQCVPAGFMDAATRPATSVFSLVLGTIAENSRMTAPILEICALPIAWRGLVQNEMSAPAREL